jgi:predicted metalloendopeptidase
MTPQTVNAYFNPLQNEIVFPAGILQPPFFDMEADDAINYGAIGMVIGTKLPTGTMTKDANTTRTGTCMIGGRKKTVKSSRRVRRR